MSARVAFLAPLALGIAALAGAQPPKPVGAVPPVEPLPVVPKTVGAFVTLKVSDVLAHPDLKPLVTELGKNPEALAGLTEAVGVSLADIDRVTLFWPQSLANGPGDAVLVVTTKEPYNEARVLKALRAQPVFDADRRGHRHGGFGGAADAPRVKVAEPEVKGFPPDKGPEPNPNKEDPCAPADEPGDPLFYELDRGPFDVLFLIDERTMLFLPGGGELAGMALLAAALKKNATGPLADALAQASKHTFAAAVNLKPVFAAMRRTPPELAPYTALLAARTAVLTGDLGPNAKLALTLKFDDEAKAKRAAPVLREGMAVVAEKLGAITDEYKDSNRPIERAAAPLQSALVAGLKKATVSAADAVVVASTEVDAGPAAVKALTDLAAAIQSRKKAEARMLNLKQIGLALHNYHDATGKFPANVYGPKGELLLSWRVQILPYIEEDNLYRQFKMDEPWDSANNKPLIEKMPKIYAAPDRAAAKGMTYYQSFAGPNPKNPPPKGVFGNPWLRLGEKNGIGMTSITDGTFNTLAVVEARDGVVWSKPDDLPFGGPVPLLGEKGVDRAPALRFDGSTFLFPNGLTPERFWPYVTVNGGEVVEDLDDRRFRGGRAPAGEPPVSAEPLPPKGPPK